MMWGNNKNYMDNPCFGCKKERLKKIDGKYIRCDMDCSEREKWRAKRKQDTERKIEKCEIADTLRALEHKRCTTKKRKAV